MKNGPSFRKLATALAVVTSLVLANAQAETGMMQDMGDHREAMNGMSSAAFLINQVVDGYHVRFHVMAAPEGQMQHGDHHFMIQVMQDGRPVPSIRVNSKVIGPDGRSQSHPMMIMGDWFMAAYDMSAKGRYQLLILFKTPDGKKHKAGVYYPE